MDEPYGSEEYFRARVREREARGEESGLASVHCRECWMDGPGCCESCSPHKLEWTTRLMSLLGLHGEPVMADEAGIRKVLASHG